jgi:hypothetical protein
MPEIESEIVKVLKAFAERRKQEALEAQLAAQVECPKCHHKFIPGELIQ